ncbi:MAG: stage 0 sporulation family protein [Candidatus Saganbacteria bacterium]|nr:stage 0 sporulation family protein [Candidatus Saganbacteria bacterium]
MSEEKPAHAPHMAIKLRKFDRVCPITGYKEGSIKVGSPVIVQTDRGVEYGEILEYKFGLPKAQSRDVKLKKVLRYATAQDIDKVRGLPDLEEKAISISAQKILEHELPIKIVSAEYLFDANRAIIYYKVQEGKKIKNLRDLTRDLSSSLEARISLRQVSPRDEARMCGGLGPCGRPLCCAAWLEKPRHVTVRMVKDQGLQISPTKTSGICGRLMCCLEYEYGKNDKGGRS